MSTLRFYAIKQALNKKAIKIEETERRSAIFGRNVFNEDKMRQYLTKEVSVSDMDCVLNCSTIDSVVAENMSTSMEEWAISNGVTRYTHWFQPLTAATADKHDAFFEPIGNGRAIEKFGGGQ